MLKLLLLYLLLLNIDRGCHGDLTCSLVGTWYDKASTTSRYQLLIRVDKVPGEGLLLFAITPTMNWASGEVTVNTSDSTVTMSLDDREVIYGRVSHDCTVITWVMPDGLVWLKTAEVDNVHVIFMNHLDVGYASFIANVINEYFQTYFPRAMRLAAEAELLRPDESFIYTTHPWLVSFYLDCPSNLVLNQIKVQCPTQEQVANFTDSIKKGHIAWHAGPMNMQVELMNEAVLEAGLTIARNLDNQFGHSSKVISQRDVPGMTAAAIPSFVSKGIKAVSVGVNPASAPPAVPKIFNWNDAVIGLWHAGGYPNNPGPSADQPGGLSYHDCAIAPSTGHALCFAFRTDNTGPPTSLEELDTTYQILREEFTGAKVFASTLDQFIDNVDMSALPKVNGEIGDTWIQGIASDPRKTAEYRAMAKGLLQCMSQGKCKLDDPVVFNASRYLIKVPEHTWGLSGISDRANWSNAQFKKARGDNDYVANENSWREQRQFLELTMEASTGHPLHDFITSNLAHLDPAVPDLTVYNQVTASQLFILLNGNASIRFDPRTGSVINLVVKSNDSGTSSSVVYANSSNPLGVFTYHTYNEDDFMYTHSQYGYPGNPGYDKPNSTASAHPVSQTWPALLIALYQSKINPTSFITHLRVADPQAHIDYGAPADIWVTVTVTAEAIDFDLVWVNKTATRLAEATMFSFYPAPQHSSDAGWDCSVAKVGVGVLAPVAEVNLKSVVYNGSQYQHAVEYVAFRVPGRQVQSDTAIVFSSPDVPLVCPILDNSSPTTFPKGWTPTPFPAPLKPLTDSTITGIAFNLHNNIWNTNYPLYYPFNEGDENFRAKFTMQMKEVHSL